jgi:hypothetical protein
VPQRALNGFSTRLNSAYRCALLAGELKRDNGARQLWHDVYGDLSKGCPGLVGALTSRAEAQVTRLALTYALLDEADAIAEPHLRAALALWEYARHSVEGIFQIATGNPDADAILRNLRQAGAEGLSRTEISSLFGRNLSAARIDRALELLSGNGLAQVEKQDTGGRPVERWFFGGPPADEEPQPWGDDEPPQPWPDREPAA